MTKPNWWRTICLVCVFCAVAAIGSPAQAFKVLANFDGNNGASPVAGLVQAINGDFYGTTSIGGANCAPDGCGTVFRMTPGGALTTLYSFCAETNCTDGYYPAAGLVQGPDGNFYGTTEYGGAYRQGTVFKITPGGTLTTLHSFDGTDGANPYSGLVQATDGNFYGTTYGGGASDLCQLGCGTIFKINPRGTLIELHSFNLSRGAYPVGGLIEATDGNFYGTTTAGGTTGANCSAGGEGCGTVFKITPTGTPTTLYSFCAETKCTDGHYPWAGLAQANDGNFYGTTFVGGARGDGTIFQINPGGTLTTLYNFCSQTKCSDGLYPEAGLVQATDGNFYGATLKGGANAGGYGTVFRITPGGTLTTLHSFDGTDGSAPVGTLVQATNGIFYGTATSGGTSTNCTGGCGTVFVLGAGLGPFVETRPTSGKVGQAVLILGDNLTGTTSVTFNGTPATFTVLSSSEIRTTVPSGATTGPVQVTTPSRTLTSNVNFQLP